MLWQTFVHYWHELTYLTVLHIFVALPTMAWALAIKKDSTSALAWCLFILLAPYIGFLMFVALGYQQIHRPVSRKQKHRREFRLSHVPTAGESSPGAVVIPAPDTSWEGMAGLALRFDAFPQTTGNHIKFFYEGQPAYDAMLEAIRGARHHVHLEFFIVQPDASGDLFLDLLAQKAREGVEVRLLYDAMGSYRLHHWKLRPLREAGGKCTAFLSVNLLRRRFQINMRNHRKVLVVDGKVAFTGGLNIGDEYLGKVPRFGFWRDTHLRAEGPVVASLQRIFIEDWDFAADEHLKGPAYFPAAEQSGPHSVQVIQSGPDQVLKGIREIYFAAILRARKQLWIASPYFVPDAGLLDALCLAGFQGVDVRLLGLWHPDKWIPYFAGRYYWAEVLDAGVKVYQYTHGMMHSKVMLVDGQWASVGSANLDNRSLHLNFEANCLIYSPELVAELEEAFRRDLEYSKQLDRETYAQRPLNSRMMENACRLLSPIL